MYNVHVTNMVASLYIIFCTEKKISSRCVNDAENLVLVLSYVPYTITYVVLIFCISFLFCFHPLCLLRNDSTQQHIYTYYIDSRSVFYIQPKPRFRICAFVIFTMQSVYIIYIHMLVCVYMFIGIYHHNALSN